MTDSRQHDSIVRRSVTLLREALRDNDEDFTAGPIRRALALLAIPMMLEMAMESIFAVVDIAFVSRLGTDAVAAVGITEALVTVLDDGPEDLLRRPAVERYDFLGETLSPPVTDVFAGLV